MRKPSQIAVAAVALAVLSGCGGGSGASATRPARSAPASTGHYTLQVAERSPCSGGFCANSFLFAYNQPKLTKAQAIQRAYHLAHQTSLVVLRMSCHSVPKGWSCEYFGQS